MKKKLSILAFTLLLAVGWTGDASAQMLPTKTKDNVLTPSAVASASKDKNATVSNAQKDLNDPFKVSQKDVVDFSQFNGNTKPVARAPKRSAADATASATRTRAQLEQITYDWVDANGTPHNDVAITEPASNPYQIAYLLGSVYMNKDIPGTKYSTVWNVDVPYSNVYYGWDIPANPRWNYYTATAGTNYSDLVISIPTTDIYLYSINVKKANGTSLASFYGNTAYNNGEYGTTNGNTVFTLASQGWYFSNMLYVQSVSSGWNSYYFIRTGGNIIIPASQLNGNSSISVEIQAYGTNGGETIYVNGQGKTITTSAATYTWTINGANTAPAVTPPDYAGYTIFLVKVKDGVSGAPQTTWTWNNNNSLINFFDTYIDEVELLTDGTRLNEGTNDAGTMFSYSGELNRFYFIGKGKNYLWGNYGMSWNYAPSALAPTYQMYEEFSPTSTDSDVETTDFYSKLLYGNSYNVVHDCRAMCNFEHYFSMSGKNGEEHKSMTNLVFWIPDNRGAEGEREYNEEYLPHVGLYTITLEAEAEPAADYSPTNRYYTVTCDWVSSLNSILDFPVDQDYELWTYTYDANGNPIPLAKVTDLIQDENGWIHNTTTHSYNVEQRDTSYTIYYRVLGWPKDATNSYGHDPENGTFYAWSNIAPVLIPGYNNFLALGVNHYESDFLVAEEHNYYRNFLTVDNQNPNNALTAQRIEDGEDLYTLYRYDVASPNILTKAADLMFAKEGNKVNYLIEYDNQYYVDDADQSGISTELKGYKDLDALGCPTSGTIATLSDGSTVTEYVKVTSASDLTDGEYLIVYEDGSKAFNGALTTLDATNNNISVTIVDNKIASTPEVDAATFTISTSAGTIKSNSGYYIGNTANSNALSSSTETAYTNTISYNGSSVDIVGSGGAYLRYNSNSDQNRFRYFKSSSYTSQQAIQLYKKVTTGGTTPTVKPVGNITISMDNGNFSFRTIQVKSGNTVLTEWSYASNQTNLPSGWSTTTAFTAESTNSCFMSKGGTITINSSLLQNAEEVTVVMNGRHDPDYSSDVVVTVAGSTGTSSTQTLTQANDATWADYTWNVIGTAEVNTDGLLNDFLDNSTYTQVGMVVFQLPWKSIQVKLQEGETTSSAGYFFIQNNGKLRFIMPSGYNNASLRFVIHNAPVTSDYYHGTFTLKSSTGETKTIEIPEGSSVYGDRDYEVIFTGISSGDVITITGTHTHDGTLYNYSPDFKYIHVYVQGGHDGVAMNDALNLSAVKFVDQFKAETKTDSHPYRYGYVLKSQGDNPQESAKPEVPVQHTNSSPHGYYTTEEIQGDTERQLTMNVMNAEVPLSLSTNPQVYYYTLERKPSTASPEDPYEEISKLQKREDDTYMEMSTKLGEAEYERVYDAVTVPRYDNYNVQIGNYNDYMNYVPVVWTHGELSTNRRIKWESEKRHNSYGAPTWKTGVGDVKILSADSWRQQGKYGSTNWVDENNDSCSLYFLEVTAQGFLPTNNTVTNENGYVPYVPYWFNVYAVSESGQLRGYNQVLNPGTDPEHTGDAGSHLVNDPERNRYIWHVYGGRTTDGYLEKHLSSTWADNFAFGALNNISDLQIVVRFYYVVNGMIQSTDYVMDRDGAPAGYGAESPGYSPEPHTGIIEVLNPNHGNVVKTTYVNPQGLQSDKPFDGVNIVINRYEDGTTSTSKVIR